MLDTVSAPYDIFLPGMSSSPSIRARSSTGNSRPTRRAVRRTFSSCSIPTEGLYRSSKACHQRLHQSQIPCKSVDFVEIEGYPFLRLFVSQVQILW
jgi:hypothetical protein